MLMVNLAEKGNVVLVVDDSPETLGMLNQALEKSNMTTLVALEGIQAISIAKKMVPDIILLDAIMPKMDGFETCKKIKSDSHLKHIPIIFMTGLSDTDSVVKGFEVGGVDYLTKPINPVELIARMNVHLFNARATSSAQQALDSTGQNLYATDAFGKKIWATPRVESILEKLKVADKICEFDDAVAQWLLRKPNEGNKLQFPLDQNQLIVTYIRLSSNGEYLLRLVDDQGEDEQSFLRNHFGITKREADVFLWLAKGKTNREIALILDMSPRTVNKHLEQLFKKLGVDNRTSAAGLAIQCLHKVNG